MGLPQIDYATYQLTLPSTGKKIKYRPFNVKEEKILMMALESESEDEMINAILQIIDNCTMGNIKDVENLPYFDVEYLFIQLRKKSISETINATKKCSDCGADIHIEINLDEVTVNIDKTTSNVIEVTDTIGIEMKYPSIVGLKDDSDSKVDRTFNTIISMIASIYEGDTVHKASDSSQEELSEWIESLPEESFKKINDFMANIPKMTYDSSVKCPSCDALNPIHLEGLQSFFG